jgi:DNA repair exonuclease SbcCD nuclease subunit
LFLERFFVNWLVVGDPHGRAQDIDDLKYLLNFIVETSVDEKCDGVIILGDLFHNFSILHVDVVTAWSSFCSSIDCPMILLSGNHDFCNQDGGHSAIESLSWAASCVFSRLAPVKDRGAYFMPFHRDVAEFERQCRSIPAGKVLFCHQSFNGAKFDNGFYDPHGADPDCVKHLSSVVSGHVHTRQQVSNIWYPGSPRHMSFSDAGQEKDIFVVKVEDDTVSILKEIPTLGVRYYTVEAETVKDLLAIVPRIVAKEDCHYSFKARGSAADIAAFWADDGIKTFRGRVRRVVDNLLTDRGSKSLTPVGANTAQERFDGFIKSKKWRTPVESLSASAQKLLSEVSG